MASLAALAQSDKPPARIGLLPELNNASRNTFIEAMQRRGWQSGRDFVLIEPTSGQFRARMVPSASRPASEDIPSTTRLLVQQRPDVILATSTAYAVAVHQLSSTTPVVMWTSGYPVEAGLAEKLARPGKNVTGNSIYAGTGLWAKLVELLHEAKPSIKRVAVLWDYVPPGFVRDEVQPAHEELASAARKRQLDLRIFEIGGMSDARAALQTLSQQKTDGLIVTSGWGMSQVRQDVMRFAAVERVPVIVDFRWPATVDPYPLLVYGAAEGELMASAADYTVQILKGANPGDLPITQPTRFDLIVNLKSAAAIGLKVPQVVRLQAREVIE